MKEFLSKVLKMTKATLKLVSVVIALKFIAFPAHNLEIVVVKHALWTSSFVEFVIQSDVMWVKVGFASLINGWLTILI